MAITLKRYTPDYTGIDTKPTGYPIKIEAISDNDMPSEIFVFKHVGNEEYIFTNVAALYELTDLTVFDYTVIENDLEVPYFRKAIVELILPSIERVDEIWQFIQEDVQHLVKDYNYTKELNEVDSVLLEGS